MSVQVNFADIYLQGMGDRSMQSGMELPWEIQLTDSWTAGAQGKLVLVVLTKPSLGNLFHFSQQEKYRPSIIQITDQFKFFTLRFLSKQNLENKFILTNKIFFHKFSPSCCLHIARKPVKPVLLSTNTKWYLYSFWALFVLHEVQLDNNGPDYKHMPQSGSLPKQKFSTFTSWRILLCQNTKHLIVRNQSMMMINSSQHLNSAGIIAIYEATKSQQVQTQSIDYC